MKKVTIIVTSLFACVIIILIVLFFTGKTFILRNANLNDNEKQIIKNNFSKSEIQYLLKNNCDLFITTIVNDKDFKKENMKSYCEYHQKYENAKEDTVYLVNHNLTSIVYSDTLKQIIHSENILNDHINRYLDFIQHNDNISVDEAIKLVNLDYDKVVDQNDITKEFFLTNHFISNYLSRYLQYKQHHNDLDTNTIVSLVNSNRDYTFYTNVNLADKSKKETMLVNKYYSLSKDYVPELVTLNESYTTLSSRATKEVSNAFSTMVEDAKKQNLTIYCQNGYRSYDSQNYIFNDMRRSKGDEYANLHEARAGFSEYQTGLSLELIHGKNQNQNEFKDSKEFAWLKENAYKYGFILRYPEGKENITGFAYKPYYFRYVGKNPAKTIWRENITLEEYYAYYEK